MVCIPFVINIFYVQVDDLAADVPCFRVPRYVIADVKSSSHIGFLRAILVQAQRLSSGGEVADQSTVAFLNRFARSIGSSCGGDGPLELDFRPQPFEIPVNQRDRQFPAPVPIRDRAVSRIKLSIDFGSIPSFGMADISETEIVLLGPEERDSLETFPSTQHIARGSLPLALRDNPVFDTNPLPSESVRPTGDVAGRKYSGNTRFQVLIHRDATIYDEPCLLRQ
jgi:hypothetical protein